MLKQCRLQELSFGKYRVYLYHDGKEISREEYWNGTELDEYLENLEKDGYKQCYTDKEIQEAKTVYDTRSKGAIGGAPRWLDTDTFDHHCVHIYKCSACGKEVADDYISYHKYCLHCGSKMYQENDKNDC